MVANKNVSQACHYRAEKSSTYTNTTPLLNTGVLGLGVLQNTSELGDEAGGAILGNKCADSLLLVLGVRGEQLKGQGLALEGVGHEDGVLVVVVGGGQDVAALDGLVEEAKDVHDDENGLGSILGRASHVRLLAVNGLVGTLLLVA